jgi:pseudoazurin
MNFISKVAGVALAAILATASPLAAANFDILMLNTGDDGKPMGFSPAFVQVQPGDTVTFIPADKGHNAETILDMIPAAADTWKGKTNEQFTVTLTEPGLYAYKCQPHFGMGMVGLIQVGPGTPNMDELASIKLPPKAQARMMELFAKTSSR